MNAATRVGCALREPSVLSREFVWLWGVSRNVRALFAEMILVGVSVESASPMKSVSKGLVWEKGSAFPPATAFNVGRMVAGAIVERVRTIGLVWTEPVNWFVRRTAPKNNVVMMDVGASAERVSLKRPAPRNFNVKLRDVSPTAALKSAGTMDAEVFVAFVLAMDFAMKERA